MLELSIYHIIWYETGQFQRHIFQWINTHTRETFMARMQPPMKVVKSMERLKGLAASDM